MTRDLPYATAASPAARPQTSWAAVTSLVCGILLCIPILTSLIAVATGFLGIRQTRDANVGGRGMAIAGLVLGIAGLLGWSAFGGGMLMLYRNSEQPRQVAEQWIADLAAGNLTAATAVSDPAMPPGDLMTAADYLGEKGTLKDVSFTQLNARSNGGTTTWTLGGTAHLSREPVAFEIVLLKTGQGTYVVRQFNFW